MIIAHELTELAAKAAGIELDVGSQNARYPKRDGVYFEWIYWTPLEDDLAAFRLAVKLRLEINIDDCGTSVRAAGGRWHRCEVHSYGGVENATRHAIVLVAAELGEAKQ